MSRQEIDQGHQRFLEAMRANDVDALMKELADDVVFYPPNEQPAKGKAAVRSWYEGVLANATTGALEVPERDVVIAGDWAIERGSYVWEVVPADGAIIKRPFGLRPFYFSAPIQIFA